MKTDHTIPLERIVDVTPERVFEMWNTRGGRPELLRARGALKTDFLLLLASKYMI